MAINTSGYVQICEYSIDSSTKRLSKEGKLLKKAFKDSPSPSVIDNGKIIIDESAPSAEPEATNQQDNTQQDNHSDNNPQPNEPAQDSQPNENSNNNEDGNESYHYSMFEAYMNLRHMFEADDDDSGQSDSAGDNSQSDSTGDSNSDTNDNQSDSSDSSDKNQSDNKESDNDENKDDNKEDLFRPGSDLYVQVLLPHEGCTVWHLKLDSRVDKEKIVKVIQSKNFKSAFILSSKGLGHDGIAVLSAKTYLYKQADLHIPFIGNCRYAMDSGSENKADDSETVVIAVAPIDGRTGNPNEDTVLKAVYNIVGDISNGELPFLKDLENGEGPSTITSKETDSDGNETEKEETVSGAVSKWLNANNSFKCVGDKTMVSNFDKLREFVSKNVADKKLEYNNEDSTDVVEYSKLPAVKKSLIYY